jgi:hypothetical protein
VNEEWLLEKLLGEGIEHISDISYAEYEEVKGLYIQWYGHTGK